MQPPAPASPPPPTPPPAGPQFAPPWPYPPPPAPNNQNVLLIILVIVIVAFLVLGALVALVILPIMMGPTIFTSPSVALGPVDLVDGNATFGVTTVTPTTLGGLFGVNLRVSSATGSAQPIVVEPSHAVVLVSSQRYRVYWTNVGSSSFLSAGDQFRVAGDGGPLPADTNFTFYLIWTIRGKVVATETWATPVGSGNKPVVTFSAVSQAGGNATIGVAGTSQAVFPSNYKVNLLVGTTIGLAVAMPTIGGLFVNVVVESTSYRVYWTDIGGERTMNAGDTFRVTGNNVPLPPATSFTFYLLWKDGTSIQSTPWSTP